LVVLLIVGALLNVAVAWACALWSPFRQRVEPDIIRDDIDFPLPLRRPILHADVAFDAWTNDYAIGYMSGHPYIWRGSDEDLYGEVWWQSTCRWPAIRRAGLPMYSMKSVVVAVQSSKPPHKLLRRWDLPISEIVRRGPQTSQLPSWLMARGLRRVPLVPMWPGFLINTLFWSAFALWAAWLIDALRRWRLSRLPHPVCGSCGYNLTGNTSGVCPECGVAV
jgi:hypothetical protein